MKTIKVSKAAPIQLDWLVDGIEHGMKFEDTDCFVMRSADESYVNNWAQAGPIIEREGINLYFNPEDAKDFEWHAEDRGSTWYTEGPTPLIAAMRCYVASKLGDTVEVPEELE